ncbi:MAG: cob(I)yrinic acid a,c-diamide adenosyltransferase [Paludibacteraceae bacterium]|nr:cob(I)yrinic acid a,c-diamide adenosyltransferase [Paludibacteraceae bacterium]
MKIYTKTGDHGSTSLIGGTRVGKNNIRINAYGTIDELNSFLGLLRAKTKNDNIKTTILDIQNTLFAVGANLATDTDKTELGNYAKIDRSKIEKLEQNIDAIQQILPPLTDFIIYGEDELSAICHCCRAIARRAEREIITLNQEVTLDEELLTYMNRLSDFLFVLARLYTKSEGKQDFLWKI